MNDSSQPEGDMPYPKRATGDIGGWRVRLYYWSRNPHILFWTAAFIIGVGVLFGYLWQTKEPEDRFAAAMARLEKLIHSEGRSEKSRVELADELLKAKPEIGRVLTALEQANSFEPKAAANVTRALQLAKLAPGERDLALAYWQTVCSHLGEPGADLLYHASLAKPPAHANELVGDFLCHDAKKADHALKYYERELTLNPQNESLRKKILGVFWMKKDMAALGRMRKDPAYANLFEPDVGLQVSMRQHEWGGVWSSLLAMQKENFSDRVPLILTSVAGAVWLLLAWQMAQPRGLFSFAIWAPLLALPLGALSTLPVLFLDVYQAEAWGLKHTGLFFQDCLFFLAGVGLREELCKLLFFLPFVPVLLMRKNRLEMLLVAGAVGLGFAIEENVSYFRMAEPSNAFARFLTANFFHFAATGVVGLSFCDMLRDFKSKWWHFPCTFVAVVAAHGFYDAFISVPIHLFMALGMSCFILLSLFFFRQVARERGPATDQIFPAATLILGLSVLVATIIACASVDFGLKFAINTVAKSSLSLAIFVYMFFVLFRDGMQEDQEITLPPSDYA